MKPGLTLLLTTVLMLSCQPKQENNSLSTIILLQGTWQLISETKITNTDTVFVEASKGQPMIKILNATHFSFMRHDLNKGKDSTNALFTAGGGSYSLQGDQYTEHLDYCTARDREGNQFQFTVATQNDTLIQSGREKVEGTDIDRIIIEKYVRVK